MRTIRILTMILSIAMFSAVLSHAAIAAEEVITIEADGNVYAEGHSDDYHGDKHKEIEGLPQLDFSTYAPQIFWMFVFFILLYVFFSKKTIPEISSTVENRREKIEGDLDNAQDFKEQAEKARSEYETALQEARTKASETFKAVEDDIKAENNAKLDTFKDRAQKLTQETEAQLEKAKANAMADTQSIAAEIASIAAEKIVGIPTDIKQAETLVKNINKKAA